MKSWVLFIYKYKMYVLDEIPVMLKTNQVCFLHIICEIKVINTKVINIL